MKGFWHLNTLSGSTPMFHLFVHMRIASYSRANSERSQTWNKHSVRISWCHRSSTKLSKYSTDILRRMKTSVHSNYFIIINGV